MINSSPGSLDTLLRDKDLKMPDWDKTEPLPQEYWICHE